MVEKGPEPLSMTLLELKKTKLGLFFLRILFVLFSMVPSSLSLFILNGRTQVIRTLTYV